MELIVDIAHNSFNGIVPADCFWKWDAMMTSTDGEASGKKHQSFTVLSLDPIYYQDTMTVTIIGLELEVVKIFTIFTSIDISSNHFSSEIPDTIRRLNALYMFIVSHNDFTGLIPPSIRNLSQLESLDMSWNKLTIDIPSTLTNFPFLSSFNLSYNQLEGRILTGSQFHTFKDTSYKGNIGLCGSPWMITNKDVDLELTKCLRPCIQIHINCGGPRVTNGKKTYEADEELGGPAIFVPSNENYWGYSSTRSIWKREVYDLVVCIQLWKPSISIQCIHNYSVSFGSMQKCIWRRCVLVGCHTISIISSCIVLHVKLPICHVQVLTALATSFHALKPLKVPASGPSLKRIAHRNYAS
uniref:Uncharacterized protein n=1 Tax=Lactuca sativa TaxID=4236 RepID=A0A9R1X809_LACSA|nr:hypothetical protein LSAT_V11C500248430 [Lactuca sativa]